MQQVRHQITLPSNNRRHFQQAITGCNYLLDPKKAHVESAIYYPANCFHLDLIGAPIVLARFHNHGKAI